jgi:hypothetical protein
MLQQFVSKSKNLVDTAQENAANAQAVADQKTTTFINDNPQDASEGDS